MLSLYMRRMVKYDEQAESLQLEISRDDLHIIIEGLNTLMEKRKDKFNDELEKERLERCRELVRSLYKIAANDLPERS
jgi:hypothetical protein